MRGQFWSLHAWSSGAWCVVHRNVADLGMGYVHEFATAGGHRLVNPVRSLMRGALTSG
ncbi:Uncharacterised protein [Mycobacteroides abscessus subsp. abscessus]|nr:Uncharacterised protein [Mycobacteroides abscessus subsp. abscessus]